MAELKILHERRFEGKPLQSLKVYEDPFSESEVCIEFTFSNGEIEYMCIGPGRPKIASNGVGLENTN
jgi:hypothetical protein